MWEGLAAALTPANFLLALGGVVVGAFVGALPGLTATMAVAVLAPLTFVMPPAPALILMGALYTGAIYGGAYPAILLNTPGTPSAVATTFDGYPMAKRGNGDLAITLACLSSVCGGLVGALALLLLSPPLAEWALAFGSVEYFWLAVLGLSLVSALSARDFLKGLIGACFGLLLAVIGVAEVSADIRLTFGSQTLIGGIEIVCALIGLYCIPALMDMAATPARHLQPPPPGRGYRLAEAWGHMLRGKWNVLRSSAIGAFVGVLPGAGGSIAGLVAYTEARRRNPANFGKGEPQGVQASEAANNATVGGGLIPTLVLGIPGAPPDAVILGALLVQGLRTGPELFAAGGPVYTFVWGLLLATLLMLPCGLLIGRRAYRFVAGAPKTMLVPLIGFLTLIGAFAIRNSAADAALMTLLGVGGWGLARLGFSPAPIVLGLILSGIAEQGFVQAWTIGSATEDIGGVFLGDITAQAIVFLILVAFLYPLWRRWREGASRHGGNGDAAAAASNGKARRIDIACAGGMAAVAAVALWDAKSYTDSDSAVFPVAVALAMLLCCALLLARAVANKQPPIGDDNEAATPAEPAAAGKGFFGAAARRAQVALPLLIAALAMPLLGFLPAALAAAAFLFFAARHRQSPQAPALPLQAALLLAAIVGFYLLFGRAFNVPLPTGALWQ